MGCIRVEGVLRSAVCFGESVVGVYFDVGYDVTVTRFVIMNIRTVLRRRTFMIKRGAALIIILLSD